MKNVKPLLGAISVVGKDSLGNTLMLPTSDHRIKRYPQRRPKWVKKLLNVFKYTTHKDQGNNGRTKNRRSRITKQISRNICSSYELEVSKRVSVAQGINLEVRRQRFEFLRKLFS